MFANPRPPRDRNGTDLPFDRPCPSVRYRGRFPSPVGGIPAAACGVAERDVKTQPRGDIKVAIPEGYEDLLKRPLYGHLATTRPNATV